MARVDGEATSIDIGGEDVTPLRDTTPGCFEKTWHILAKEHVASLPDEMTGAYRGVPLEEFTKAELIKILCEVSALYEQRLKR